MSIENITGHWKGKLAGTHHGSIQFDVEQSGSQVTARARITDNRAGTYLADLTGDFESGRLKLSSNSPTRAGALAIDGTAADDSSITGKWISSFGSGTFTATRTKPVTPAPGPATHAGIIADPVVFASVPPIPPTTTPTSTDGNLSDSHSTATTKEVSAAPITDDPVLGTESTIRVGVPAAIRREASGGEATNSIDRYANAIARYFRGTEGEFAFALFGPWGRGKTYLMQHVAQILEQDAYATISFSAWKYRKPPLLWASLYGTLVDHAVQRSGYCGRLRLQVRTIIAKQGLWPLLAIQLVAFFALIPLSTKIDILRSALGSTVLVAAAAFAIKTWVATRTVLNRLNRAFSSGYGQLLGLQDTIGKDLKALLISWIDSNGSDHAAPMGLARKTWRSWTIVLAVLLVSSFAITPWFNVTSIDWRNADAILELIATALFLFLGCAVWHLTNPPTAQPKKVLLIVDDLDRCGAAEMLDAAESLMLVLQDEVISARLSIAMLLHETALQIAIKEKHSTLPLRDVDVTNCIDKLFLGHLRMLPLSEYETLNVLTAILTNTRPNISLDDLAAQPGSGAGIRTAANFREKQRIVVPPANVAEEYPVSEAELLSLLERAPSIASQLCQSEGTESCEGGPRAVRAFYHRYMLARCLLEELGYSFEPSKLAERLASKNSDRAVEDWESIVQQVL